LDNFTHTLFGLTVARTPLARAGRGTMAALLLSSNAPDIDIVTLAGGPVSYLKWHRGPTHGPLGIVGLGVITAGLVWIGRRWFDERRAAHAPRPAQIADQNASFAMLVSVSIIGAVLHVLMDLPTSYGTRLLSPFDWHWFAIDLMPIIDIYLLVVLVAGLLFGLRSATARRRNALIVLTLMGANYGVRAVAHRQALAVVPRLFGPTLAQPCDPVPTVQSPVDSWPRTRPPIASLPSGRRCLVEVAAMPAFTSPFAWRIIARLSNAYELRDLDLLDPRVRALRDDSEGQWRLTLRYPNVWTSPILQAATTRLGQVFLGFSRFPAARSAVDPHGVTTVRWTDVRFIVGMVSLDQPRPGPDIFTATVRIGADGTVLQETLGR
jgi:membrane-bound metal-dependent hydrolase YbcI (DUF457 family)